MNNILITSGGRRVSLVKAFMTELKKQDSLAKVFVSDALPLLSSAAQIADFYFKTYIISHENYIDDLIKKCIENNISLIVPTIDTELLLLAKNRTKFLEHNISVVISDEDFIKMSNNKLKTHTFFKTYTIDTADVYTKKDYRIPMFIKPINGSNSIDNYIIRKEEDILKYHLKNKSLYFFEFLDHDIYDEYTCDLYYDKSNNLKCVIPRKRIEVRGGEVSKGVTQKGYIVDFIKSKLHTIKGARGCITLQLFVNKKSNEIIKGIEINARFGGGFPLSYLAGGNFPKWIIEEYLQEKEVESYDDWESNLLMLRYDDEILVHNYES